MKHIFRFVVFSLLLFIMLFAISATAPTQVSAQSFCGDNVCNDGEAGWCSDCDVNGGGSTGFCGDNVCSAAEQGWCSDCTAKPSCGDGFCDAGETPSSCVSDCGCAEKLLDTFQCGFNSQGIAEVQRGSLLPDCSVKWVSFKTCLMGCQKTFMVIPEQPFGTPRPDLQFNCLLPPQPAPQPIVQPQQPVDNVPSATISVPASAAPGSQLSIVVAGADDVDVHDLELFDSSSTRIAKFECEGVQASCSHTFAVTAPATPNTAYTFRARSEDSIFQHSAFVSGSGVTTAAAAPLPVPVPVPAPVSVQVAVRPAARLLQAVGLNFPFQSLFLRSVSFSDSDCVRPGESALLAVKVRNTGKSTLKGVSFTATVPEIGARARSGPHTITTTDKLTRFLRLDVPDDAQEGSYYLKLTVTNSKFSRTIYRAFSVGSGC